MLFYCSELLKWVFLFGVNVCAFIPMMLFMVKNCHKLSKYVCRGMGESFLLGILWGCPKALQNTLLPLKLS